LEIHLHGQKMTTSVIMLTVAAVVALALRTLGVASAQDLNSPTIGKTPANVTSTIGII
jgi:hypothetical protein